MLCYGTAARRVRPRSCRGSVLEGGRFDVPVNGVAGDEKGVGGTG